MSKTLNRINAASAVVHTAACAVVLCLMSAVLAPQAWAAEACTNCITFSADKSFGIRMVKGKGNGPSVPAAPAVTLQYSTDQVNWFAFSADTGYAAGTDHKLYLRGTGNTKFASEMMLEDCNVFTNTSDSVATAIACSGNIETLLDYTKVAAGEHPTMGNFAFCNLFCGFTALTTPPALPAMALSERCYGNMFKGCSSLTKAPALPATTLAAYCYTTMFGYCTSLTTAPELPATNLAENCYQNMFNTCESLTTPPPELPAIKMAEMCYYWMFAYCTSLTDVPELRATTLAKQCYNGMFFNCSALKVNTAQPGKAWTIPSGAVVAENWNKNMFNGTSGTLTGGPVIGTTYYVASAPARIAVTDVEGATAAAYTNEVSEATMLPGESPYAVKFGAPVSVVYSAVPGYAFPDGTTTFTTNFTVSAAETTVKLADDQLPKPLPPIKFDVTAPEGAKAAVYTNAVEAANLVPVGGTVLSNGIAFVVYTVTEEGKYFENGERDVVNTLDTANDPATDTSAYVPKTVGAPSVLLGIVAQRYPWNGILDVQYKTPYANATHEVTFKANGTTIGTAKGTGGNVKTVSIDLNAVDAFKGKALKGVKITATIATE